MTDRTSVMKRLLLGAAAAAVLLAAWIASAPPASNPDGGFHLVSIWCADGTNETDCIRHPSKDEVVLVPRAIEMSSCFAFDPLATGACAQQFYDSPIDLMGEAYESNLSGARPQLYYRVMNLLKGDEVLASITRMRALNAGLAIAMVIATGLVAGPLVRRAFHAAWLGTSIPVGLWLLSTTNTGAWIVIGAGTAWANAATACDRRLGAARRIAAGALATVGAVMSLGSRTEAIVPLTATALALAIVFGPSRDDLRRVLRSRRALLGALATVAGLAVVLLLLPRTARIEAPLMTLGAGLESLRLRGAGDPILHLLLTVPSLLVGGLGVGWGLGWIDTLVPVPVGILAVSGWVLLALSGAAGTTRRARVAVAALAGVALLFPLFTQAYYGLFVSEQFQPRHFLVLLYLVLGFAVLGSRSETLLTAGRRRLLVGMLGLAHAIMLHQQLRRYVSGLRSQTYWDLSRDLEWWWPGFPVGPTAVWVVGSVAFVVVAWVMSRDLAAPVSGAADGRAARGVRAGR